MTSLVDIAGWTLLHFVWQGTAIAMVTVAGLAVLRQARPQTRYVLACAGLVAMIAAPVATATIVSRTTALTRGAASAAVGSTATSRHAGTSAATRTHAQATPGVIAMLMPAGVAVWLAGVALLLARLGHGWCRVRALRRAALAAPVSRWAPRAASLAARLGIRRAVRIVDALTIDTPMVLGWLQPVIVLPVAALANLTPAQVTAILAHELAHIRRHDFAVNLLQAAAETVLFYHPAVWWLSNRIRAEREHCCDAIAVEISGDAIAYVEALTEIETWRTAPERLAIAATGGSLVERVRRVLDAETEPPSRGAALLLAAIITLGVATGGAALVTAVEPGASAGRQGGAGTLSDDPVAWRIVFDHPSGELTFRGYTGRDLIRLAYDLPASRVIGGPAWLDHDPIDLSTHLQVDPGADGIQAVVRELLESKMGLRIDVERRDFPAYALVGVAAPGPGLQTAAPCIDVQEWLNADPSRRPINLNGRRRCGAWRESHLRIDGVGVTMADFAERLEAHFRGGLDSLDVIDQTDLPGTFDLHLTMSPLLGVAGRLHLPGVKLPGMSRLPGELAASLGVTLEPIMHPYDVVVISSIHRPTE